MIVTVPHSMRWWCPLDEAVRHFRRYERAELCDAFLAEALLPEHVFTWGGPIYDLYYRLLLNRAKPEATWKEQSRLVRGFEKVLYGALFLDDLFSGARIGKMLFGVARKPL